MFFMKKASTNKVLGGKTSYPMGTLLRVSPKTPVYRPINFAVWFPGFTQILVCVLPSLNYFCALQAAVKSICLCISTRQSPVWLQGHDKEQIIPLIWCAEMKDLGFPNWLVFLAMSILGCPICCGFLFICLFVFPEIAWRSPPLFAFASSCLFWGGLWLVRWRLN